MTSSAKSFAFSLRAIGQALEILNINEFSLAKEAEKYVVRDWEPSFLKNLIDEIQGKAHSTPTNSGNILVYTLSDAERLEIQGGSRRGSNESLDSHTISSGLRLVGDYLDQKGAMTFTIQWSSESVRVQFEGASGGIKETSFTMQNLKDLAMVMYLRRSRR